MALTYLDTAMIEQPAVLPQLSVTSLQVGTVTGSTNIIGNLTVYGEVTALSGFNVIVSSTTTSSALSVSNFQAFPALDVYQAPSHPVISVFKNQTGDIVTIRDTGLTVNGTLSTSSNTIVGSLSTSGIMAIDTNSSSTALRVTQTGSGNAILVEDSANPDSTPFVVNQSGNVGIGTTAPSYKLDLQTTSDSVQGIRIRNSNAGADAKAILQMGNNTNGAATALLLNSSTVPSSGYGPDSLVLVHGLAKPIIFATSSSERMRIEADGKVGIGTTVPNQTLTVTGNISATGTASVGNFNIVSGTVLPKTTFNNLVSALAINVNGTVLYMPLLSAI